MTDRVVCFGEVLLRLAAPAAERLLQTPWFEVTVAGAEANVAVSLARLGVRASVVTILPDNPLGHAARDELRRHGVATDLAAFQPGRMGLYFLAPGAVLRPSQITYDRAGSAFALGAEAIDWKAALAGATWLHISGVTPAIGAAGAAAARSAVEAAVSQGVKVSFDGNFRATLWPLWGGDPATHLRPLFEAADIAFADHRDIALILGLTFADDASRARRAADAAYAAFPRLQRIAGTVRTHAGVAEQGLGAALFTREGAEHIAPAYALTGIVDRIGAGDAFAAGFLAAHINGAGDKEALAFALAAAVLKHSFPGDFNLASEAEIRALMAGEGLDVRR